MLSASTTSDRNATSTSVPVQEADSTSVDARRGRGAIGEPRLALVGGGSLRGLAAAAVGAGGETDSPAGICSSAAFSN